MEFASACVFALYIFGGRERRPTGTEDDACCRHSWRCTRRPPRGWRWGIPRKGSAWVKLCSKNEQTGNKQLCLVKYEELDPNTGLRQIIVAARSGEGEDKQTLLLGVTTAYTLIMPAGVQIKIDDGEPISLQYDLCFPTSCQGELELTKDMFEKMRKGKLMVVAAMNMQQKALAFPVPLTDFGKTFDGPPADNAKYEEAQRQMMETIRQRQIDLANKVADKKKVQGGNSPKPERRRLARRSRLSHRRGKLFQHKLRP